MTGQQASTGRQIDAAVKLYMAQNNPVINGRKVEVIVKGRRRNAGHDASPGAGTRRQRQGRRARRIRDHAVGDGHRTGRDAGQDADGRDGRGHLGDHRGLAVRRALSFTLPQASVAMAEWANKNGIKKVVTLVSDYAPGIDAEKYFRAHPAQQRDRGRGCAAAAPDFAPVLQKVRDANPQALFVFLPSGRARRS